MNIKVDINKITVQEQDLLNSGEYNVHECIFEFDEAYNGLVKKALFSNETNTYQVSIENNKCVIPYEVLEENGIIIIGVYAYEVVNEELKIRYSPTPVKKVIDVGSYKKDYDNYEALTPTDKEQMEQALENINISANKVGTITTITITNTDGTTQEVEIQDGEIPDMSNYYTKSEIDAMIGDVNSILDNINGEVI